MKKIAQFVTNGIFEPGYVITKKLFFSFRKDTNLKEATEVKTDKSNFFSAPSICAKLFTRTLVSQRFGFQSDNIYPLQSYKKFED